MTQRAIASLDALRERIREIEGTRVVHRRQPSGVASVDRLIGGLPSPGIVEVHGALGSGRTRVALALAAACTARRQPVAWVDPLRRLYPPAAEDAGVDLERLLVVRPPADRDAWAVEQLCRSGAFPLVIVADPPLKSKAGQRWSLAAESGACTVVVLAERPLRDLPAVVRLSVRRGEATVVRDRGAEIGRSAPLPPLPRRASPWS